MIDDSSKSCLVGLSYSLKEINKSIKDSRKLLLEPINTYQSVTCRSTISAYSSPKNIDINVRLNFDNIKYELQTTGFKSQITTRKQSKIIEQKSFGVMSNGIKKDEQNFENKYGQNQNQKTFSFGDIDEQNDDDFETNKNEIFQQQRPHYYDEDAIKIIQEEDYQSEDQYFKTPKKQAYQPQNLIQTRKKIGKHIDKTNQKQVLSLQQEFRKIQERKTEQKQKKIKQQLRSTTDTFIQQSILRHKKLQQQDDDKTIQNQDKIHKNNNQRNNRWNSNTNQKHKKYSRDSNKTGQKHNHLKIELLNYFSKSQSITKRSSEGRICEKFRRQLERDKKQKHIAEALKIRSIDRYYTFSQIQNLYQQFRCTKRPHYKWIQFLMQRIKGSQKFSVLNSSI